MESGGDAKRFLQALIQVAAACVHLGRGNGRPAIRLLTLADEKLARFGDAYAGVGVDSLRRGIAMAQERILAGDPPGHAANALQL